MKAASFILVFLMLFLTAQPLLIYCQASEAAPVQSACSAAKSCKKEKSKPAGNEDCNRESGCNPFASCSQCPYVGGYRIICAGHTGRNDNRKTIIRNENIIAGFKADCWHPPELSLS